MIIYYNSSVYKPLLHKYYLISMEHLWGIRIILFDRLRHWDLKKIFVFYPMPQIVDHLSIAHHNLADSKWIETLERKSPTYKQLEKQNDTLDGEQEKQPETRKKISWSWTKIWFQSLWLYPLKHCFCEPQK